MINRQGVSIFRIFGEPQPMPKENASARVDRFGNAHISLHNRDYRTKKVGEKADGSAILKRFDTGYMARWQDEVRRQVFQQMAGSAPFPKGMPLAIGILIIRTKPKSNDTIFPVGPPDIDNFDEAIFNALKAPAPQSKKLAAVRAKWPNGVLFYDDAQIVERLLPSGKIWAVGPVHPGAIIQIRKADGYIGLSPEMQAALIARKP